MMKTIRRMAPVCLWVLLLLPFFVGALAAHPATDDFTFALYTHPTWVRTGSILHVLKDALSYALRTWRDWQGTVSGVILMTLSPIVFSLRAYGIHAVALLLLNLGAWLVFLRHMLGRRMGLPRRLRGTFYLALSACLLLFLPDMVEGIYWFNGAWFYMGAQAVALLTLTFGDRLCESRAGKSRLAALSAAACLLLFALGMDNYITAMMTAAALFFMALQRFFAGERKEARRTALLLIPIGAGLLLSVVAPGNAVRMAADGAHQSGVGWLLLTTFWTLRAAVGYFARFLLRTPLLALLLCATPALCRALEGRERARRCPPIPAVLAGLYLILCAMIIPHMYSSGYAGSGRVVNMYHCYVLLAVPLAWVMCLMRMGDKTRARLCGWAAGRLMGALALAALAFCLAMGQLGNYVKLVRDQLDGTQAAYTRQFQQEYALLENAGPEDDVELPAWTVQTVTGKPTAYEDASMWTNEAMAQYFGVRSVRVAK